MSNSLNVIVLDSNEQVIRWLDPELCDIVETSKKNACRKIELTYPYESEVILEDDTLWYQQGNKIFVPSLNGIKSCLYVINTDYDIDFWKENTIKLEAEEVIVELNNDVLYFEEDSIINITLEKLDEWFGSYFDIKGIDTLASNRKQVTPSGIMTRMSLFRMIEEQTDRIFISTYTNEGNKILRSLYLANPDDIRFTARTETLDLNYNLESLEFTKSEEDTYTALAPIFSNTNVVSAEDVQSLQNKISAHIIAKAELSTENLNDRHYIQMLNTMYNALSDQSIVSGGITLPSTDNSNLIQEWLDYEVMEGQEIPMIIKTDEEGNVISESNWYAPFEKSKGELYIKYNGNNQTTYSYIQPYNESKAPVKYKCGVKNTNETLVEAIYNELALSLLNKINPEYELEVSVKDIQQVLGLNDLGYQLHESLHVRVPNFNYYVPCRITETTKNLHHPGENKIKIETEVTTVYNLEETLIKSENRIISANDTNDIIGGLLVCDNIGLPDQYVTMNIRLVKGYTATEIEKSSNIQQQIKTFDPVNEYYVFSEQQIANLEKAIRNDIIKNGWDGFKDYYRLRDVDGNVYSVPYRWCISIYCTRNQFYCNNEEFYAENPNDALGNGFFDDTISVHYYPDAINLLKNTNYYNVSKLYYPSIYYLWWDSIIADIVDRTGLTGNIFPPLTSSERQNGPTCTPASLSNVTSILRNYHSEYELATLMGTMKESGTSRNNANKVMTELGFNVEIVEATADNIIKYVNPGHIASIDLDASKLGEEYYNNLYHGLEPENHSVIIYDWYWVSNINNLYVAVMDTNIPVFNPAYLKGTQFECGKNSWISWNTVLNAINAMYHDGVWYYPENNLKHMSIISNTEKNIAPVEEVTGNYIITPSFSPELNTYKFHLSVINTTIKDMLHMISENNINIDIMSSSNNIVTASNSTLENISMWWLRALLLAGAFYYQNNEIENDDELVIEASPKSNSMKYYNHFNTLVDVIGDYDWFTPCNPNNRELRFNYICSTLLFYLGICYNYLAFTFESSYMGFEKIGKLLVDKAGKTNNTPYLNYFVVPLNSTNIGKYLKKTAYHDSFMTTVILTYAYSTDLNTTAIVKDDYYPVMLYNKNGSNVDYMNISAGGNNLTNRYNTRISEAENYNPFKTTSISNIVSWNSSINDLLDDGDKGNMLVISYYTKAELEAM